MFSFIEREDFIALLKEGISERSLRIEFGLTKEYIDSLKKSISLREDLVQRLESKDTEGLQKLIRKGRKKEVLIDYVASFSEDREDEFFESFDSDSKQRFLSLLDEYGILLEKKTKKEEMLRERKDVKSLTDEEIQRLREEAEKGTINKKNIFAFTLYRSGRIDEAREYLEGLILEHKSYTAFRQMIHLEKQEGNLEDAKLWTLEALEVFPGNIGIKEVEFRIARQEKDASEMMRIAKEISALSPSHTEYLKIAEREK